MDGDANERTEDLDRGEVGEPLALVLFILGSTPKSATALKNLRRLLEAQAKGRYTLEVVDVKTDPDRAEAERILATPTLIKKSPAPVHRIIGDMSDTEKVLFGLGIGPARSHNPRGLV